VPRAVGATGVEVAQQAVAETQCAILPLVPYLDTLRCVLLAVALAWIAVAVYARLDDWKRGGDDRQALRALHFPARLSGQRIMPPLGLIVWPTR
jgi:hypothetical protein